MSSSSIKHTSKIKPGTVTKPRRNGGSDIQKFYHRSFIGILTHVCNAINKILDKLKFCLKHFNMQLIWLHFNVLSMYAVRVGGSSFYDCI